MSHLGKFIHENQACQLHESLANAFPLPSPHPRNFILKFLSTVLAPIPENFCKRCLSKCPFMLLASSINQVFQTVRASIFLELSVFIILSHLLISSQGGKNSDDHPSFHFFEHFHLFTSLVKVVWYNSVGIW